MVAMILLTKALIPWRIALIFSCYLILKSLTFKGDFASILDLGAGIYLALIPFFAPKILTILFAIYLGQKAVFSFT